jgi:hypothetical protein
VLAEGFILFLFPLVSIILEIVSYLVQTPVPTRALVSIYPLSLLGLLALPAVWSDLRYSAENKIAFAWGAWYGSIVLGFASIPVLFLSDLPALGIGMALVGAGTSWLPIAWVSSEYGLLISDESGSQLLKTEDGKLRARRRLVGFFLSVFSGGGSSFRRNLRGAAVCVVLVISYVTGWVFLSFAGGFPYTVFGLGMGLLVPINSYLSFTRRVGKEGRLRVQTFLRGT